MEDITDLKSYLNLREGEKILFINRYDEEWFILINNLYKYHEPEKFPEELITKKKENYVYHPINIITNFRIIQFRLNSHYFKDDQETPISEAFHFDNFIFWINNEDILDFKIDCENRMERAIQFVFYHKDGIRAQKSPIYINCSKYKNYLQVKELAINLFKFERAEINQAEQRSIDSIITSNKHIFYEGLIVLILFGIAIYALIIRDSTLDYRAKLLNYSLVSIYFLYLAFYLIFYLINCKKLQKTRKSEDFLKLIDIKLSWVIGPTWYKVPKISLIVFVIGYMILLLGFLFSSFIDNIFLIIILIAGVFLSFYLLVILLGNLEKKKNS